MDLDDTLNKAIIILQEVQNICILGGKEMGKREILLLVNDFLVETDNLPDSGEIHTSGFVA